LRAFVAIELDDACRRELRRMLEVLRPLAAGVRWVRPESVHLTLKFIGELPEPELPAALECLGAAAAASPPFGITVSGLSGFPRRGVPRVIHVGVEEPTGALARLQRAVEDGIKDALGVAREKRRFTPHVTLGRVRNRRACPRMEAICAAVQDQHVGCVQVRSIALIKSELRPEGAVYTVIERFPLGG